MNAANNVDAIRDFQPDLDRIVIGYAGATLVNHGTILSAMPSPTTGIGEAVRADATDTTIINAADGLILGQFSGLRLIGA